MNPTQEQQLIIDAKNTGENLVIEAGAGSGKTTTLKMLSRQNTSQKGIYIAFNKSVADEAARSFDSSVICKTSYALAFPSVGRLYSKRLSSPRIPAHRAAEILKINNPIQISENNSIEPSQIARLAMETVTKFCQSDSDNLNKYHVPYVDGLDKDGFNNLRLLILPYAEKAWKDLSQTEGNLQFSHDIYFKIWALSNPRLNCDYLLLDEAQDTNPVLKKVVESQKCQIIMVGDRRQAIYGWRGAIDAMQTFEGERFYLSQSFRFGEKIADEANKWLDVLNVVSSSKSDLKMKGFELKNSKVETLNGNANAVLCRTNGEVIGNLFSNINKKVAVVGGTKQIEALARASIQLKAGIKTSHPELFLFNDWNEVMTYSNTKEGMDLRPFVKIVNDYGADQILNVCEKTTTEENADLIISTCHKAKGREWNNVQIGSDFIQPEKTDKNPDGLPSEQDAMLYYVAVTRAKNILDNDSLSWVNYFFK